MRVRRRESAIQIYDAALERPHRARRPSAARGYAIVDTSNQSLNDWIERSISDVRMMITATPSGPYPYAGVPWFNTAFGRDGIITALQLLWLNPAITASSTSTWRGGGVRRTQLSATLSATSTRT